MSHALPSGAGLRRQPLFDRRCSPAVSATGQGRYPERRGAAFFRSNPIRS